MDTVIALEAAETHLPQLLERAHAGEEVIIAKAGQPDARLVPLAPAKKRPLGFVKVPIDDAFFEPLPDDEVAAWG